MNASVFRIKPHDFNPSVEVAACYVEAGGKILLLKRAPGKSQGGTWGVPAGKLELGETARDAVIRETFEETGIRLSELYDLGKLYVRYPHLDFVYHFFHMEFPSFPEVILSDEHVESRFVTWEEALGMPLISGGVEAIHHFRAHAKRLLLRRKGFYFIRHGETDANGDAKAKLVDADLPLNGKGREQALSQQNTILNLPIQSVCYSPIQRAKETKEILMAGRLLKEVEIAGLSECRAQVWTNMVKLEEGSGYHTCDEVAAFLSRAIEGLSGALEQEGVPLIVAHGGIHWAICYHLMIENHPWKIGNCQLVHFLPKGERGWEADYTQP
jgi:8-oxo-dGTP pyrophosphatase MutT (NUDIX family)/broad specificity phosphatase PhoE